MARPTARPRGKPQGKGKAPASPGQPRDIRGLMEAHGITGRTLSEYQHAPVLAQADDELVISGILVADRERSWYMDGEVVSPAEVRAWLADHPGDCTVRVNSPGGDYFAGVEVMNALREHDGMVGIRVVGLAASAASLLAMGGDTVEMLPGSLMMIHRAWSIALGNAPEMRAIANRLELIDGQAAQAYAARAGTEPDDMLAYMDAETWFDAAAAVETGLADDMGEGEGEEMGEGEEPDADMNAEGGEPPEGKPDTTQQADAERAQETSFAWLAQRLALLNGDRE